MKKDQDNSNETISVDKFKSETLNTLYQSQIRMGEIASEYQRLHVEHFTKLTNLLVTLSAGSIVFTITSLSENIGCLKWIYFLSLIFFLITILSSLTQFYLTSSKYKRMETYKNIESKYAESEYDRLFEIETFNKRENDDLKNIMDNDKKYLDIRNRISFWVMITQSSSFFLGVVTLSIYFIIIL